VVRRTLLPDYVERYVAVDMPVQTDLEQRLRAETARLPEAAMQIGADQGALLALLVRTLGARRAIEIGTFTGYSALKVASALPSDGELVCCDVNREWTGVARRFWHEAGVSSRIDLRIAPALETLASLIASGGAGTFDFAFIDADKTSYDDYYEHCLRLLRSGGLVALDNMLRDGTIANPSVHDASTDALRALNAKMRTDARVDACLLSVGDGVMLARKR